MDKEMNKKNGPGKFLKDDAVGGANAGLILALNSNVLPQDVEMLKKGYVPIHWLLAKLTYEEAAYLRQLSLRAGMERKLIGGN